MAHGQTYNSITVGRPLCRVSNRGHPLLFLFFCCAKTPTDPNRLRRGGLQGLIPSAFQQFFGGACGSDHRLQLQEQEDEAPAIWLHGVTAFGSDVFEDGGRAIFHWWFKWGWIPPLEWFAANWKASLFGNYHRAQSHMAICICIHE